MNIVFNTNYKGNPTETCFHELGGKFKEIGHNVVYDDWNNYQKYDIAFFIGNDSEVRKVKKINPKALTGILSPYLDEKKHREESKLADFLLVDSIEMRETFLKYNKNILIYYMFPEIKNVVRDHEEKDKIIIGYHGNKTHLSCMDYLSKALDDLAEKYNIEFWAIYNIKRYGKWKKNLPKKCQVKHIQWSKEDYCEYLLQCDIGIMSAKTPINVNFGRLATRLVSSFLQNWPRYYKADYLIRFKHSTNPSRIYAFSQLSIPVVADFMPSCCQVIQDGYSGFLVYSREGWFNALEKLIIKPELRNQMSQNLKNSINNNCSPKINFNKVLEYVQKK